MNPGENPLNQLADIIKNAKTGVILLPVNPTQDAIAASTSLYLGLSKLGKNVSIAASNIPQSDLTGADKIMNSLSAGGDNLVVSFPYIEGSIDKVDYSIQGNSFNLIITPRSGQPKLEPNKVQFSYTGGSADFIITIDAPNLNALGPIYTENQKEFQNKSIINIDRHLVNDLFGTVNLVNKTSSSTSELVLRVLQSLGVEIDKDMATNLYTGLTTATNNFTSYSVNANTFETAAALLKLGAIKRPVARPQQPVQNMQQEPLRRPQQFSQQPNRRPPMNTQQPQPMRRPQFNNAGSQMQTPEQMKPIEDVEQDVTYEESSSPQAPQDWLKPKIFRGGGLV